MPLPTDFDVHITRVLLVHRMAPEPDCSMSAYRGGRNMHGLVCPLTGGAEYLFEDGFSQRLLPSEVAFLPASAHYRPHTLPGEPNDHYTVNFFADETTLPPLLQQNKMHVLSPATPRTSKPILRSSTTHGSACARATTCRPAPACCSC